MLLAGSAAGPIVFEEIAERSGLTFVSDSSPTPNKNQPETMVAGVALFDYDNDGYLDVYLVNGAAIPSLQKESPKYWNRLYHNNHDGTFTDVTEKAGCGGRRLRHGSGHRRLQQRRLAGHLCAEYREEPTLPQQWERHVYRRHGQAGVGGGCSTARRCGPFQPPGWTTTTTGCPDLFVSNYCKWEVNKDPFCGPKPGLRTYCHPKNYGNLPNTLYRNNGDGTFTDVSAETGIAKYAGKGMGAAIADYDGDGFMDIFVANDNRPNFLFHNLGGKKFEEVALEAGVAYVQSGSVISGMGADFKDVDNDGRPDIWHTAVENETFPLFQNRGGGQFWERTYPMHLAGNARHVRDGATGSSISITTGGRICS